MLPVWKHFQYSKKYFLPYINIDHKNTYTTK